MKKALTVAVLVGLMIGVTGFAADKDAAAKAAFKAAYIPYAQKDFEKAQAAFEKVVKDYPASPVAAEAQNHIGLCLDRQGKSAEAQAAFQKLIKDHPAAPDVPFSLVIVGKKLEAQGKVAEAGDILKTLVGNYLFSTNLVPIPQIKQYVADVAVALARQKLVAEGKPFVTKGGVNPLAAYVQPVVDALNAPGCVGLEKALSDVGLPVPEQDRAAVTASVAEWQKQMMAGKTTANLSAQAQMVLGVSNYNAWVDLYNNGKK